MENISIIWREKDKIMKETAICRKLNGDYAVSHISLLPKYVKLICRGP